MLEDEFTLEGLMQDEEPARPVAADRNAVAIAQDLTRVQNALGEFDRVAAGLADIEARYPKDAIYEVTTTKGMKDAVEHRAAWREPRITVEKARKMAKAPLLAMGKNIDARAAWITEKLREGEEPIDQLIKVEETRKEEEKQARINAEAGRILRIQEALAEIGQDVLIACSKTSVEVRALSERMHATQPDRDVFQEMHDQAKAAWTAGIAKLETTLKAKLWDEEQQARAEAERLAEIDRQAKEKARLEALRIENERIAAEQKAERDRLAAERAEFERKQAEFEAKVKAAEAAPVVQANPFGPHAAAEQNTPAQDSQQVLKAEPETADATDRDVPVITSPSVGSMGAEQPADAGLAVGMPPAVPTLTLGEINLRLSPLSITTAGLELLGFTATKVKAASMYRDRDWPEILHRIAEHVTSLQEEATA